MLNPRRRTTPVRPLALMLLVVPILLSASVGDRPLDAVRTILTHASSVVATDSTREQKLELLRTLARDLFDTDAMGRDALGPLLVDEPAAQQEEFLALFDEFIVRAYLQKMLFFRDPEFAYGEVVVDGDTAVVHTSIKTRKDEFYIDYAMQRGSKGWVATDIVVEGMSLIRNYGDQFQSLLRTLSFEELLDRLRRKVHRLRGKDES